MKFYRLLSAFLAFIMVFALCPAIALDTFADEAINVNKATKSGTEDTIYFKYEPNATDKNIKSEATNLPLNVKNSSAAGQHSQLMYPADFFDADTTTKNIEGKTGKFITKIEFPLSGAYNDGVNDAIGRITVKLGTSDRKKTSENGVEYHQLASRWDSSVASKEYIKDDELTTVFPNKKPTIEKNDGTFFLVIDFSDNPFLYTGDAIIVDIYLNESCNIEGYLTSGSKAGFEYHSMATNDGKRRLAIAANGTGQADHALTRFTFADPRVSVSYDASSETLYADADGVRPSADKISVIDNETGTPLAEDTHYTVSFAKSDGTALAAAPTEAGSYVMNLNFTGSYTGTRTVNFTINPGSADPDEPEVDGSETTIFFKDGSGNTVNGRTGTAKSGATSMPIALWGDGKDSYQAQMIFADHYYDSGNPDKKISGETGKSLTKIEFILSGTYSDRASVNSTLASAGIVVKVGTTTTEYRYSDKWNSGLKGIDGLDTFENATITIAPHDSTHDKIVVDLKEPFEYTGGSIVLDFTAGKIISITGGTKNGYEYVEFSKTTTNKIDYSDYVGIGVDTSAKNWLPFTIFTFKSEKVNVKDVTEGELTANKAGNAERYPTIEVKDAEGNPIAASNYTVSYTTKEGAAVTGAPTTAGEYIMVLTFNSDYDNVVKKVPFTVQPFSLKNALAKVAPETVYIQTFSGISDAKETAWPLPFNVSTGAAGSHSQMLYLPGFCGSEEGNPTVDSQSGKYITQLEFFMNKSIAGKTPPSITVKLATADLTALSGYYSDTLTPVFTGVPTIKDGNVLVIELDEPFKYDGKAIVVDVVLNEKSGIGFVDWTEEVKFDCNYWVAANGNCLAAGDGTTQFGYYLPHIRMTFKKAGVTLENCRDNQILTHDGTAKAPTFTLYDNAEGRELVEDTDYTVSYSSGSKPSDIGQYTMTINFIGAYEGTDAIFINFEIKAPAAAEIQPIDPMVYNGKPQVPGLIVKGDTVLVQGVDYEIVGYAGRDGTEYSSTTAPTNVGKYTVTIQITGNGTKTADFEIIAKDVNGSKPVTSTHDLHNANVNINYDANYNDSTIYDYTYNYKTSSAWFAANSGSKHIQTIIPVIDPVDHENGGRADYLSGLNGKTLQSLTLYTDVTSGWSFDSAALTVKLLEVSAVSLGGYLDVTNAVAVFAGKVTPTADGEIYKIVLNFDKPYTYKGGNLLVDIEGSLTATDQTEYGGTPLSFYGVSYQHAKNGTIFYIPGQNRSYNGAVSVFAPQMTFGCEGPETESYNITATPDKSSSAWNNTPQAPTVTVTDGDLGTTLKEGTDYVVKYDGSITAPTNAGTYEVTVEFTGNYTGTKSAGNFTIGMGTLPENGYTLTFIDWHEGQDHGNEPILAGSSIPAGATITYAYYSGDTKLDGRPTAAGAYKIKATIVGTTNYGSKTISKDFTISAHDWKAATCYAPETCQVSGCGKTQGEVRQHNIQSYEAKAPTCTESGYDAYVKCEYDDCDYTTREEKAALGHTTKQEAAKAPTCTVDGWDAYEYCEVEGCGYTTKNVLSATGHVRVSVEAQAPTCTAVGWDAYEYCKNCDYTTYNEKSMIEHSWADANCNAPSTCSVCGATTGEPLGHDWKDATCTAPKTCQREGCGATEGSALGHTWVDADCTTPKTCSRCGATDGEANGHDWFDMSTQGTKEETPATCTTEGKYVTYQWCWLCDAKQNLTEVTTLATGHTEVIDAAVAATCASTGKTEGKHCSVCNEVLVAQSETPKLGHTYGVPTFEWSATVESATCTATFTCTKCETGDNRVVTTNCEVTRTLVGATCGEAGTVTYTATVIFNEATYNAPEKTVTIQATGEHNYATIAKDESGHWGVCSCGATNEKFSHVDETAKDHKCDTCEYVMSECADSDDADHKCDICGKDNITNHFYGDAWKSDATNHWHECACGAKSDDVAHADENTKDHKCDTCEYVMSQCADNDKNHSCDVCGTKLTECADSTNDHNCDVCGTKLSECADNDKNHNCDVCGTKLTECADSTNDHNCDVCGTKLTECADSTNDHNCDVCGTKFSECSDGDDANHSCDICGKENVSAHIYADLMNPDYRVSPATCTAPALYYKLCSVCGIRHETETFAYGEKRSHIDNNNDRVCDYDDCKASLIATDKITTLDIESGKQAVYTATIVYGANDTTTIKLGSNELFSLTGTTLKLCGSKVNGTYANGEYTVKVIINPDQKMVIVEVVVSGGVIRRGTYEMLKNVNSYTITASSCDDGDVIVGDPIYLDVAAQGYEIINMPALLNGGKIYNIVMSFTDARTDRRFAWTANSGNYNSVQYRKAGSTNWTVVTAKYSDSAGEYYYYKADISNLTPGIAYEYQIGGNGVWSDTYTFTTAAADSTGDFTFVAIGDSQSTLWNNTQNLEKQGEAKLTQAALAAAMENKPAFILHTGDIVNNGNLIDQWNYFFRALGTYGTTTPFFAAVGNHDVDGVTNENNFYFDKHFNHPDNPENNKADISGASVSGNNVKVLIQNGEETIYSFDYGEAHIIVLNSGAYSTYDSNILEKQEAWLIKDLDDNKHAKWTIVMCHQPVYHRYDDSQGYDRDTLRDVIEDPQYGVDLVIQGHSHLVTRTYPMQNGQIVTKENPDVITSGRGVVYITVGATTNIEHDALGDPNAEELVLIATPDLDQPTYAVFNVTDGALTVTVRQLDGLVLDKFILSRTETEPHDNVITIEKTDATCTTAGYEEYKYCQTCKDYIVAKVEIPATGHTLTHHAAVAATCTTPGAVEYWSCSVCNTNFADGGQYTTNELKTAIEISALGHKDENKDHVCDNGCSEPQGTHADSPDDKDHVCDYGCNAVLEPCADPDNDHKCDVCQTVLTTCKDENNDFKCDVCGADIVNPYTSSVTVVPELSGEITASETDRQVTVVYKGTITFDSAQGAGVLWDNWVGFKLTAPAGVDMSNVTILRPDGETRNMAAIKDGDDYTYLYWGMRNETNGTAVYKVDWNSDEIYDLIIILDASTATLAPCTHPEAMLETLASKAATCTATGLTEGKKCKVCGTVTVPQTETPATGHTYSDWVVSGELKTKTCTCGAIVTELVENAADDKTVTVPPTTADNKSHATVGKNVIETIANDTTNTPSLHFSGILDLIFDNAAIKAALGQIAETVQNVTIYAEKTAEAEKSHKYEIHLKVDGVAQESTSFGDGKVTVTIPLVGFGDLTNKNVKVWYVENGTRKNEMASTHDRENGKVTFKTNHFSEYEVEVVSETPETPTGYTVTLDDRSVISKGTATTTLDVTKKYNTGDTFTVTSALACVVAISTNGGATYTELTCTAVDGMENTYRFTIPTVSSDFQIGIVLLGDARGDGIVAQNDATRILRYCTSGFTTNNTLDSLTIIAADSRRDGSVAQNDATRILRYCTAGFTSNNQLEWNVIKESN